MQATRKTSIAPPVEKQADSIAAFCKAHDIGRATWYTLAPKDRPKVIKIGRRTLIPREEAAAWRKRMAVAA